MSYIEGRGSKVSQSQDKRFRRYLKENNQLQLITTIEAAKLMEWSFRLKYAYCILFKRQFQPFKRRMKSYIRKRYDKMWKKPKFRLNRRKHGKNKNESNISKKS